ncbi:MAG: protein translocase subunit SecDF [Bacteroidia bacterium]
MQNIKGAIRIFAILMAASCLFYLSFTFVTRNWEKKAAQYAENYAAQKFITDLAKTKTGGDEFKMGIFLDSVKSARERFFLKDSLSGKKIYLGLYTYDDCKEKELNLGLDLKGGMNVTMEVSVPDIVRTLSNNSTDPGFIQAMEKASKEQLNSTEDFVTIFGRKYKEVNPQGRLSSLFASQLKSYDITFNSTDEQVLAAIRKEADAAVERAKLVLETRINEFGVAQPNIQHLKSTNRILVELPGVKDEERVSKILQSSANLEFWETYEYAEIAPKMKEANDKLKILLGLVKDTLAVDSSLYQPVYTDVKTKEDSVKAQTAAKSKLDSAIKVADSLKALAAKDTTKKQVKGQNPLFDLIVVDNMNQGKGPMIFGVFVKDTSAVMAHLNRPEIRGLFPTDSRFAWTAKPETPEKGSPFVSLIALRKSRTGGPALAGDVVSDARKVYDQMSGSGTPEISMAMNAEGAKAWARITKANIGKSIAIVLDDKVYSYPTVNGEITGGQSQITGNFSNREADDLVKLLNTGKLPARAVIVEKTVVGPTLGQEAIRSGLLSFVVALIVVLIYMAFYYSKAGIVADIALFVNVFFIMGILTSLGAVLTLPGIAGVVLTIALSVDANILIFERVREELREGKGLAGAIADGYKHAMSSILDSNLTTLILGIILYAFGSGPVQGFATTLIIGILSSLFCAIFITRLIFDWMLSKDQAIAFSVSATENVLRNTKINFVGNRTKYYIFSGLIITLGVVFFFKNNGFSLGVDFSGGRTYTVRFSEPVDREKVRTILTKNLGVAPEVKTAGGDNQLKITTNVRAEEVSIEADKDVDSKVISGLTEASGGKQDGFKIMSSIKVGPSIANEVVAKSFVVVIISCALMFLYILFRFRKWQYGLGAVAALVHDVMVILSFYAIFDGILPFSLEIDQHFIAAILTVMGYSMTDTVVVFDRIREFLAAKGLDLGTSEKTGVINYALNSTLSRTINTSMITFFVLLAIFIFGGETIRGFSFALLIGIVIGTYSSLCIATPIVVDFDKKSEKAE